jgi:Pyruvate/2-oxoacid:ferredoxin oxidoreductase delta subunit
MSNDSMMKKYTEALLREEEESIARRSALVSAMRLREKELQDPDQIKCDTCKVYFPLRRMIVLEHCGHGNPYMPTYGTCYVCSDYCKQTHDSGFFD